MERPLNEATPPDALTVSVPESVPPPGLVARDSVTLLVAPVTRLPCASEIATEAENAALAADELGWVTNDSAAAGPGTMLNAELVAPVTPVAAAVSVYPVRVLAIDRSEYVATPLTALTVVVPASTAVPALPNVTATAPVNPVARLPL